MTIKRLITWVYGRFVGEPFIPPYLTFSVGMGDKNTWNSFLPDTLVLHVKTHRGWRDVILER